MNKDTSTLPEGVEVQISDPRRVREAAYVVVSLYTPSYQAKADRLAASCHAFQLPTIFYRTPHIHHSIAPAGTEDVAFSKPAFIDVALRTYNKPALFLDADMVIKDRPELFRGLDRKCDLAIYNWFADPDAAAWGPMELTLPNGRSSGKRYWYMMGAVDYFDQVQLMASGATQFWNTTPEALSLLADWRLALTEFPGAADDECLDFAFNNRDNSRLRHQWLDKSHVRYPWWPHVKPVINHPDEVTVERAHLEPRDHRQRHYNGRMGKAAPPRDAFPRWGVLDTEARKLMRAGGLGGGDLVFVQDLKNRFWI